MWPQNGCANESLFNPVIGFTLNAYVIRRAFDDFLSDNSELFSASMRRRIRLHHLVNGGFYVRSGRG
jgi:hypothetical protein